MLEDMHVPKQPLQRLGPMDLGGGRQSEEAFDNAAGEF
jgi:hypothetical protein